MGLISLLKKNIPQNIKNIYHFKLALLAVIWFRYPANNLKVIGVTGTDGKTTTATLIYQILRSAGKRVALISTVAAYIGDKELDTGFHVTAPDPWLLQKLLRKISDMKYEYVVLEATSHGLDQYRLLGTNIRIAVLTNITHEHLDYHKTYENYVRAKAKLFGKAKISIINKTDKSYSLIKKYINKNSQIISYNTNSSMGRVRSAIKSKFPQVYNQLNATAAYHAAKAVGVDDKYAEKAIRSFEGVAGRMEEIKNNKGIRIVVDFAHTPNALENVLKSLKRQTTKDQRLIAIFGCASERDDAKRPMMGEISTRIADISIFTAEDPRREDINKIIEEMVAGAKVPKAKEINLKYFDDSKPKAVIHHRTKNIVAHLFIRIPERGEAISFAINKIAKKGDIVVMCGKGHEKSMSYNGVEYPWSDQEAVKMAFKGKVLEIKH